MEKGPPASSRTGFSKNGGDILKLLGEEEEPEVDCEVEVISWRERRIRAQISVNADLDSVWNALTDYERLADSWETGRERERREKVKKRGFDGVGRFFGWRGVFDHGWKHRGVIDRFQTTWGSHGWKGVFDHGWKHRGVIDRFQTTRGSH